MSTVWPRLTFVGCKGAHSLPKFACEKDVRCAFDVIEEETFKNLVFGSNLLLDTTVQLFGISSIIDSISNSMELLYHTADVIACIQYRYSINIVDLKSDDDEYNVVLDGIQANVAFTLLKLIVYETIQTEIPSIGVILMILMLIVPEEDDKEEQYISIVGGGKPKKKCLGRKRKRTTQKKVDDHDDHAPNKEAKIKEDEIMVNENICRKKRYEMSEKGRVTRKTYMETPEGAQKRSEADKRYSETPEGAEKHSEAYKRYSETPEGAEKRSEAYKRYSETPEGAEKRSKADKRYSETPEGAEKHSEAYTLYSETPGGAEKRSEAYKRYSETPEGAEKRSKADKRYSQTFMGRLKRCQANQRHKRNIRDFEMARAIRNKYMRLYRQRIKEKKFENPSKKQFIDFSSNSGCNTKEIRTHIVSDYVLQQFQLLELKKKILSGRSSYAFPIRCGKNGSSTMHRCRLAAELESPIIDLNLSRSSLKTVGVKNRELNGKQSAAVKSAASRLANSVYLKRQQCIAELYSCNQKLRDFAGEIIAKMDLVEGQLGDKNKGVDKKKGDRDRKCALLGMQCHQRGKEAFFNKVSYKNGNPYDYEEAIRAHDEKRKQDGTDRLDHQVYLCNDNCALPDDADFDKFNRFLLEASKCEASEMRSLLQKYVRCSKFSEYREYSKETAADLDSNRVYLFPVKYRNHPQDCYIPCHMKRSTGFKQCTSYEVVVKKVMVHFNNAKKIDTCVSSALKAHKLLCDLDAATLLFDLEYMAKILKVSIKNPPTYSKNNVSEARKWTSKTIEEDLTKMCDNKINYRQKFDNICSNNPKNRCSSCNVLARPSQTMTITEQCRKLKNDAYTLLCRFLAEKDLFIPPEESGIAEELMNRDKGSRKAYITEDHPNYRLVGLQICNYCYTALNANKIPRRSLMNGLYTGECPEELKGLNVIESMFCRIIKCFQTIIKPGPISSKLPASERVSALKGRFIHLPLALDKSYKELAKNKTKSLLNVEDFVLVYGLPTKDKTVWKHLVDRKKVHRALTWLCENNPHYRDVVLPEDPEDILPPGLADDGDDGVGPSDSINVCDFCGKNDFELHEDFSEHERKCKLEDENNPFNDQVYGSDHSDSDDSDSDYVPCSDWEDCESDSASSESDSATSDCSSEIDSDDIVDFEEDDIDDCTSDLSSHKECDNCSNTGTADEDGVKYETPSDGVKDETSPNNAPEDEHHNCDPDKEEMGTDDAKTNSTSAKDYINNPKEFIKRITRDDLKNEYADLTVVGTKGSDEEALDIQDIFKVIRVGSDPIPSHADDVEPLSWPEIFPMGQGAFKDPSRKEKIHAAAYEKARIMSYDGNVRRNIQYLFFLVNQREMRSLKQGIFNLQNSVGLSDLTKGNMHERLKTNDQELRKRISQVLNKLPSRAEYWNSVKLKLKAMIAEYGPATFWLTLSPGDYDDDELLMYLREMNSDLSGVEDMSPSRLISLDPVLACTFLEQKYEATLDFILSDYRPIGKVVHHFSRTEYQTRLLPHYHMFFWIEDAPIIGVNTNQEVLDFISKHISCKLPDVNEDPEMRDRVKRFQMHRCNQYCLRKPANGGRSRCKFSFPRQAREKAVLYDVISSIASRKAGSYKKRLYEIERKVGEERINDYNPLLFHVWKGNNDIQYIAEDSETIIDYIAKYATKGPKSSLDEFHPELCVDKSDFSKLLSFAIKMMSKRELGAMEARNFLMGKAPWRTDASFEFVNTRYPQYRKQFLKTGDAMKNLADDSKDIFWGNIMSSWYPSRPDKLEDMSLYEFVRTYVRTYKSVVTANNQSRVIELKNGAGLMMKRVLRKNSFPPVVQTPYLDPLKQTEEFHYSKLVLHRPWRVEGDIIGSSATYVAEFDRVKKDYPDLKEAVRKDIQRQGMQEVMKKKVEEHIAENAKVDPQEAQEGAPFAGEDFESVCKNSSIKTEEELASVIASFSKDQKRIFDKVVENVEHCWAHSQSPPKCSCNDLEPLLLYITGFAGSGKSYLIKALMGWAYVKSHVRKENCNFLLGAPTGIASHSIGGQTLHTVWHIAVEHKNQHSRGKYSSSSEHVPLGSLVKEQLKAAYRHASGHIVDEISMVSNEMLLSIENRMEEIFEKGKLFGGLPILFFGDLFQLQPVNGQPPYVPLKGAKIHKMHGGIPVELENAWLWKAFKYEELTYCHRQDGEDNTIWRDILSRVRLGMLNQDDVQVLNSRLISISSNQGDTEKFASGDRHARFIKAMINKFMECEDAGLKPVCLLPLKSMVDEYNRHIMLRKGENPINITASDSYSCSKALLKTCKEKVEKMNEDSRQTAGLEHCLRLARNSRVMLRRNIDIGGGLANGTMGIVQDFVYGRDGKTISEIQIKFDDLDEVQSIGRDERRIKVRNNCYLYRKQFPISLSYAMTIHKSQSLSLGCVFADLGDEIFCEGQSYVALSRCKSLEGLHLMNFNASKVRASRRACIEYMRLKNAPFIFNQGCKNTGFERVWYTTSAYRKAKAATASEIKVDKKAKPQQKKTPKKGNGIGSKTPKGEEKKKPVNINAGKPKKKPKPASTSSSVPTKGKKNVNQPKKGSVTPDSVPVSIPETYNQVFNYFPVGTEWQQFMCRTFDLHYHWSSTTVEQFTEMRRWQEPVRHSRVKIVGDGNCFYRAISYVLTGHQEEFREIREMIIDYIEWNYRLWDNGLALEVAQRLGLNRQRNRTIKQNWSTFVLHHRRHGVWANEIIMDFAACLLQTPLYLFTVDPMVSTNTYAWYNHNMFDTNCGIVWRHYRHVLDGPVSMEDVLNFRNERQGIYLDHENLAHFEVAHFGLNGTARRYETRALVSLQ